MLRVGLTGSIAVGKSLVSATLAELGCHVLDADATARDLVTRGTPGLEKIVENFGSGVLNPDGTLDRTKLGGLVLGNETKRELLNSILHPYIIAAQDRQLNEWQSRDPNGISVVDAALMIESGGYRRFDKLIVVHCRPDVQLERLIARNGLTPAEAQARIDSQMTQKEKMSYADFLIDNSGERDDTRRQTEEVYRLLRTIDERESEMSRA